MGRILILIMSLLLLASTLSSGQTALSAADSLTYKLYLDKNWEKLLSEAKKSLRHHTDFYYLRVRAGVAAFELGKFRTAAFHFAVAHRTIPTDEFVNSYLIPSLRLGGLQDEAVSLTDQMVVKKTDSFISGFTGKINSVSVETLFSINQDFKKLCAASFGEPESYSNYRSLVKNAWYRGLAMDFHITPRLNLYNNFSHLRIERLQNYYSAGYLLDTTRSTSASQYQYYLQGRYLLKNSFSIYAGYSGLWGESIYHSPEFIATGIFNLSPASWKIRDYVFHAGIGKETASARFDLSANAGKINRNGQLQLNGKVVFYPLKNLNLFFISAGSFHFDKSETTAKKVFIQKATMKTGPVWLTVEGTWGNIRNFSSNDGLVIYNIPEKIRSIYGIAAWIPFSKSRFNFLVRTQRAEKEGTTFVYSDVTSYSESIFKFKEQNFLITLQWNL